MNRQRPQPISCLCTLQHMERPKMETRGVGAILAKPTGDRKGRRRGKKQTRVHGLLRESKQVP